MAYTALPNMPGIRIKAKAQAPIPKRAPHHGENEVILARKSDLVERDKFERARRASFSYFLSFFVEEHILMQLLLNPSERKDLALTRSSGEKTLHLW
jgi:hypothetical protein